MTVAARLGRTGRGAVLALAAALLFGVNGTVSKVVLGAGLQAGELMALRVSGAAVVLLAALALTRREALVVRAAEVPGLLLYGLVGVSLVQWLYFVAIARLPVGIALLIEFTAPLLVALWVRLVRREPVRRRVWGAVALCLGGLALVGGVAGGRTRALDGVGVIAAAGAALALALYFLSSERALARRDAVSLAGYGFAASSLVWVVLHPWWRFPFGLLGSDVALPPALPGSLSGASVPLGVLVGWVVLGGTVVPFLLTLWGLGLAGSTRIALVGTAEPVLAGMVAWAVLGERLGGAQLVGVVVVMAGIVLAVTARGGSVPRPSVPAGHPSRTAPADLSQGGGSIR